MNTDWVRQSPLRFVRACDRMLLEKIQRLRYQVYCLDRGLLPPQDYPSGIEFDEFDPHAMHFAAMDGAGHVVGTVRVVMHSPAGFPLDRYCLEEGHLHLHGVPRRRLGEISRLAVRAPLRDDGSVENASQIHRRPEIALGLYREMYHASREAGISHLIAAMERPLVRLLGRFALPFRPVGPEFDYCGPVRPYLLDIADSERAVYARCPDTFARFVDGLPRHLQPRWYRWAEGADRFGCAAFR